MISLGLRNLVQSFASSQLKLKRRTAMSAKDAKKCSE